MTTKNQNQRRADLAKIHLAKKELGLDDATYRAMLDEITGKASAGKLTARQRGQVLDHLRRLGWQGQTRRAADDGQSRKIRALWLELHRVGAVRDPSEKALASYARRMTGRDALQWCASWQKSQVIEALKGWLERVG